MFLIDSHCHLNVLKFATKKDEEESEEEFLERYSVDAIIQRAHKASIKYMLAIGTELTDVDEIRNIADNHENIFRSVGIHPQEAQKHCSNYSHDEISEIKKTE